MLYTVQHRYSVGWSDFLLSEFKLSFPFADFATPLTERHAQCRAWLLRSASSCSCWTVAWRYRKRCGHTCPANNSCWKANRASCAPTFSTSTVLTFSTRPERSSNKIVPIFHIIFIIRKEVENRHLKIVFSIWRWRATVGISGVLSPPRRCAHSLWWHSRP